LPQTRISGASLHSTGGPRWDGDVFVGGFDATGALSPKITAKRAPGSSRRSSLDNGRVRAVTDAATSIEPMDA
jgi:hypothetical protein